MKATIYLLLLPLRILSTYDHTLIDRIGSFSPAYMSSVNFQPFFHVEGVLDEKTVYEDGVKKEKHNPMSLYGQSYYEYQ